VTEYACDRLRSTPAHGASHLGPIVPQPATPWLELVSWLTMRLHSLVTRMVRVAQ
jgi:hypothetical protein